METLAPLSKQEMVSYILHRFQKSGVYEMPRSLATTNLLWRSTKGYPRLVNKIMSRALLVAYAEKETRISKKIVREAIASLNTPKQHGLWPAPFFRWATALILMLALLWTAIAAPVWLRDLAIGGTSGASMARNAEPSPAGAGRTAYTLFLRSHKP